MEKNQVDILITDIIMPSMSGIELMEEVRRRKYDLEIIVLSCHNDFDYSRKAMQLGVCDYLFKPAIMPEEITRVITASRDILLQKRDKRERFAAFERSAIQHRNAEVGMFFSELLDGKKLTIAAIREQYSRLDIALPFDVLSAAVLVTGSPGEKNNFHDDEYLLRFGIRNALEEICSNLGALLIPYRKDEYIILQDAQSDMQTLEAEISLVLENIFQLQYGYAMQKSTLSLENLHEIYHELLPQAKDGLARVVGTTRYEISSAKRFIRDNLSTQKLDVETVSRHVNLSRNYFSSLFRRETGQTFTEFLTLCRVERANELYKTTNLKIYQIADMVGYSDWRYLTKVFKRITGHNMTEL